MQGEPALEPGFDHLPYADPQARQGGSITYGVVASFDSLNPFILKSMRTTARGMWGDPQFGHLIFEPLMFRSRDEPFTMYGLLAESVTMPEDRSWIEFHLNPQARWSDGEPVTPDDVLFTFDILTEHGRPPYSSRMDKIAAIEKTGERSVKFTFNEKSDREFPLIIALSPVLPRHATVRETFPDSTLVPPVSTGPYRVEKVEPGSRIVYRKRADYWGKDLAVTRGLYNFDRVTVEYFGSIQALFEAFKKGLVDIYFEGDPAQWERAYDFPAVHDGRVRKEIFEQKTPAAMTGFVFNTRRPVFAEREVRRALAMLFDFEWINRSLFFGTYARTASFWQNSGLSAIGVPANERERELLAPFPDAVTPAVLDGTYRPSVTDGSGRDRKVLRAAYQALLASGYRREGEKLVDSGGRPLAFEMLTRGENEEKLAIAYRRTLETIGITVSIRSVDDAQYQLRLQDFDYDMVIATYTASLSPGIEQVRRWGSLSRDVPGSFNFAGAADPAIDAMIDAVLRARSTEDFRAAVRALDRVLISGHYLVPLYHLPGQWVASWTYLEHPGYTAIYGYQLPTWWDTRAD
ncbi:MAG: extracellular solute-binding protein [Pseudomonadota bacterium]|nr:extracellular solute-binding protein [Pseudomonadota bacterium]